MSYTTEIEYKFFPKNIEQVVKNLNSEATKTHDRRLMRAITYRRADNPSFIDMDVLRIRDEGNVVKVTMKQRFIGEKRLDFALEKEFEVSDFEKTAEMFQHLGLFLSNRSEKYRTTWEYGGCEIVLDENPWIDPYFEIEGPDEATLETVCRKFDCDWDSRRDVSGTTIYDEKYHLNSRQIREFTFEKNCFI